MMDINQEELALGVSLLLQEVELMETLQQKKSWTVVDQIASFIGSGINGNLLVVTEAELV